MIAIDCISNSLLRCERNHSRGMAILYAIISQVFFITMFTCLGYMRKGYSVFYIIQGRMIFGLLFNYIFCYLQKIEIYPKSQFLQKLMIMRGVLGGIAMLLVFTSFRLLNMSDAVVVTNTYPIFTCFLAFYFLNESLTKKSVFFSFLSFIGIVLIVKPEFIFGSHNLAQEIEGRNQFIGCMAGLLSSCCMSFVLILMRKMQHEHKCNNAQILMYSHFCTPLISGIAQIPSPINDFQINTFFIIMIIIISIAGFTAQMFYSRSFTLEKASIISPLQYTQVIMSFFVDIYLFNESLTLSSIIGSILVIIGSVAVLI